MNKCLPFGSSRSCAIFQQFSYALAFIAKVKMVRDNIVDNPALTNYLDDFLFIVLSLIICNQMMAAFMQICNLIGCPISEEKTEHASPILVFLGMLLNGRFHVISVPQEKVNKSLSSLKIAIQERKVTIKYVQQLTGTLNFLNRARDVLFTIETDNFSQTCCQLYSHSPWQLKDSVTGTSRHHT